MTESPRTIAAWVSFAGLSVAFVVVTDETARWWIAGFAGVAAILGIRSARWESKDAAGMWAATLFPGVTMILGSIAMLCKPHPESAGVVILAGALLVACLVTSMTLSAMWFLRRRERARSGKAA